MRCKILEEWHFKETGIKRTTRVHQPMERVSLVLKRIKRCKLNVAFPDNFEEKTYKNFMFEMLSGIEITWEECFVK